MEKKALSLQVQNLKFELSQEKPNWFPFTGTCLFVDEPSSGIPSGGSEDKPVLFPKDEVEKSLTTFENMGVDCVWPEYGCPEYALTGHDTRNKIGCITSAEIVGNEVVIKGGLWEWDFEDVCDMVKLAKNSLGWSIEVRMYVEDSGDYYTATDLEFSGVALLYASAAAFDKTRLSAQKRKGIEQMTKEEVQEMLNSLLEKFDEKFSKVTEEVEKISNEFSAEKELREQEKKEALELAAKEKAEADAKLAEEAKVAAELAAKKEADELAAKAKLEAQRQTKAFPGVVIGKFSEASDEVKAVVADEKLSGSQKFQKLINLKLQAKE